MKRAGRGIGGLSGSGASPVQLPQNADSFHACSRGRSRAIVGNPPKNALAPVLTSQGSQVQSLPRPPFPKSSENRRVSRDARTGYQQSSAFLTVADAILQHASKESANHGDIGRVFPFSVESQKQASEQARDRAGWMPYIFTIFAMRPFPVPARRWQLALLSNAMAG